MIKTRQAHAGMALAGTRRDPGSCPCPGSVRYPRQIQFQTAVRAPRPVRPCAAAGIVGWVRARRGAGARSPLAAPVWARPAAAQKLKCV
jgi:hypothetical protein